MSASMRVLVAGGAGFLGSNLVRALVEQGRDVTIIDNLATGRRRNLEELVEQGMVTLVEADLTEPLPDAVARVRFDRVYHLASPASPVGYARRPIATLLVNSVGTRNLLELAAAWGARFLLASTSEAYGDPLVHPQPETYWGNVNPVGLRSCYDEGKRFAESLTVNYGWSRGVDVRIARIFNTYGPGSDPDDGRIVPNFCVQALRGERLTIYGDGSQTRSLCYVEDLIGGMQSLMESLEARGEVVNLGSMDELRVSEIAERILQSVGRRLTVEYRPLPADDPVQRKPDIAKAERILGWAPRTGLDEGLGRTLDYFRRELAALEAQTVGTVDAA